MSKLGVTDSCQMRSIPINWSVVGISIQVDLYKAYSGR